MKWPNDVVVDDRKLAGILAEADGAGAVVVGMGLNVRADAFPPELADLATACDLHARRPSTAATLLVAWLRALDARLDALDGVVADAADRSATLGRRVRVELARRDVRTASRPRSPTRASSWSETTARAVVTAGDVVHLRHDRTGVSWRRTPRLTPVATGSRSRRDEVGERGGERGRDRAGRTASATPSTVAIGCTSRTVDDEERLVGAARARRPARRAPRSGCPTRCAELEQQLAGHAEEAAGRQRRRAAHAVEHEEHVRARRLAQVALRVREDRLAARRVPRAYASARTFAA